MRVLRTILPVLMLVSCQYKETNTDKSKADKAQAKLDRMEKIQRELLKKDKLDISKAMENTVRTTMAQNVSARTYNSCTKVKNQLTEYTSLGEELLVLAKHPAITLNNQSLMLAYMSNASTINSEIKCDVNFTEKMQTTSLQIEDQFESLEKELNNKGNLHFVDNGDHYQLIPSIVYQDEQQNLILKTHMKVEIDRFIDKANQLPLTDYNDDLKGKIAAAKEAQTIHTLNFDMYIVLLREYEIVQKKSLINTMDEDEVRALLDLAELNQKQAKAIEVDDTNQRYANSLIRISEDTESHIEEIKTHLAGLN